MSFVGPWLLLDLKFPSARSILRFLASRSLGG